MACSIFHLQMVIGAVAALSSFGMTYLFLDNTLTPNFIWGSLLLIAGTALVSQVRFTRKIVLYTIHAGIFFAMHNIAMKGLFLETSFDDEEKQIILEKQILIIEIIRAKIFADNCILCVKIFSQIFDRLFSSKS